MSLFSDHFRVFENLPLGMRLLLKAPFGSFKTSNTEPQGIQFPCGCGSRELDNSFGWRMGREKVALVLVCMSGGFSVTKRTILILFKLWLLVGPINLRLG